MIKVLITGTFDIIHPGHLYLLKTAKAKGDFLIVVVARDMTVKKVKGRLPLYPEKTRIKNLKKLKIANRVVLGQPGDKLKIMEKYQPDIICLGYDQKNFTSHLKTELKKRGLKTRIIRLKSFKPRLYKSSILASRLAK
jgi:FAD synthetase